MKYQELKQYFAYCLTVIILLIEVIPILLMPNTINERGETVSYWISDAILIGAFGLFVVLIFIVQKKNYWKHAFTLVLIIALFFDHVLQFYGTNYTLGIGILQFNLLAMALLVFHLGLNPEPIIDVKNILKSGPKDESVLDQEQIDKFKQKFASKSVNELEGIVSENSRTKEAVEAARLLLQDEANNRQDLEN